MKKLIGCLLAGLIFCFHLLAATSALLPLQPFTVTEFVDKMVQLDHYDRNELLELFQHTAYYPEVIERINKPFEEKPWDFYKNFFITPDRIEGGVQYWHEHAATLEKASKQYGVSPAVIVAIIGIETKYGQEPGRFPELSTLATLFFRYPKRAVFFQNELENYLLLTREYQLSPLKLYGSYAGALGIPQFMPSNYRQYAVSYDGKSSVNLWKIMTMLSPALRIIYKDPAGSLTSQSRSRRKFPAVHPWLLSRDAKPKYSLKTLAKFGIHSLVAESLRRKSALVVMHNTHDNEYWLTFPNFYAIMAYNPRTTYAMAIYQLSEAIKKNYAQANSKTGSTISAAR